MPVIKANNNVSVFFCVHRTTQARTAGLTECAMRVKVCVDYENMEGVAWVRVSAH